MALAKEVPLAPREVIKESVELEAKENIEIEGNTTLRLQDSLPWTPLLYNSYSILFLGWLILKPSMITCYSCSCYSSYCGMQVFDLAITYLEPVSYFIHEEIYALDLERLQESEFMTLEQDNMIVDTYEAKFMLYPYMSSNW